MVWIRAKTESLGSKDPWGVGQYRFLAKRGEGGFGRVYLADNEAGDLVAVKVLNRPPYGTEQFIESCRKEAERAAAVTGRYTIEVLEFGVDDENPWLAMPFVDGPNLGELAAGRPLPPDQVTNIAFRMAEGLFDIHATGFVHRDLNPNNVLVSETQLRIVDFGIAKDVDRTFYSTREGMGTARYKQPEAFRDEPQGPPSDVFSWAATVCYLVQGRHLFDGTPEAILGQILDPPYEVPRLPDPLNRLVLRSLEPEQNDRPTASEITSALSSHVDPEWHLPTKFLDPKYQIEIPPRNTDPRLRRQRPKWFGPAAIVLALGLAGVAWLALSGDNQGEIANQQPVITEPPTTTQAPPTTTQAPPTTTQAPLVVDGDPLPLLLKERYLWGPSEPTIVLQEFLGLPANGLYDNRTREAHLEALSNWDLSESWAPKAPMVSSSSAGLIAISMDDPDNWSIRDIWVSNPDGSELRNITECRDSGGGDCSSEWDPTWSPDGTQIAYSHPGMGGGISIINADGTGRRQLLEEPHSVRQTSWSPDGLEIAFISYRDSAETASSTCYDDSTNPLNAALGCAQNLFLLNAVSGQIRQLTEESAQVRDPDWSPSGNQLAFSLDRGPGAEIFVINRDGTNLRQLTDNGRNDYAPKWNPTGDAIAYWGQDRDFDYSDDDPGGDFEIWLTDLNRNIVPITDNSVNDFDPTWSPDGTQLIFQRGREGDWYDRETLIWENGAIRGLDEALNPANGLFSSLGTGFGSVKYDWWEPGYDWWVPDPAPSPNAITMTTFPAVDQIFFDDGGCSIMNPDGTNRRDFGVGCGWSAALSPDGKHVAYAGNRPGGEDWRLGDNAIFVMDWTGNNVRQVTFEPLDIGLNLVWSPDSTKIAFQSSERVIHTINADGTGIASTGQAGMPFSWHNDLIAFTGSGIFVMNSDGAAVRRLTNGEYLNHQPQFSPDGQSIAFSSDRDGNREIYVMDVDGSNVRRITDSPSWEWMPVWSPDGKRIAFGSDFYNPPFEHEIFITDPSGANTVGESWFYTGQSGRPTSWNTERPSDSFSYPTPATTVVQESSDDLVDDTSTNLPVTQILLSDRMPEEMKRRCFIMDSDGKNRREFDVDCGLGWAMSPNGTKIAYAGYQEADEAGQSLEGFFISLVDRAGNNPQQVTFTEEGAFGPIWSSDSSQIAFMDYDDQIWTMNSDGSNRTPTGQYGFPGSWHGDQITFHEDWGDGSEIFVMSSDGSTMQRLTNNRNADAQPRFSPNGDLIVFSSDRTGDWEIYVMAADGSDQKRLTFEPSWELLPVWSPDGTKIAFASDSASPPGSDGLYHREIFIMDTDGNNWFPTNQSGTPDSWRG